MSMGMGMGGKGGGGGGGGGGGKYSNSTGSSGSKSGAAQGNGIGDSGGKKGDISGRNTSHWLSSAGAQLFNESTPLRQELLKQGNELATTGGIPQSKVPLIQRAVEAQKQATSQNLRGAQDQLSGAGLADSPFAQGIMQNIRSQGDTASAGVSAQLGESMLQGASSMASGIPGLAIGAVGNAGQLAEHGKAGAKGKG